MPKTLFIITSKIKISKNSICCPFFAFNTSILPKKLLYFIFAALNCSLGTKHHQTNKHLQLTLFFFHSQMQTQTQTIFYFYYSTSLPQVHFMATHITTPTRTEVVSLLRTARKFPDYNIREYTKRRTLDGFRQNSSLSDPAYITNAYADGVSQLEVAQRVNANPLSTPSTPKLSLSLK